MNKKILYAVGAIIIVVIAFLIFNNSTTVKEQTATTSEKDATYIIAGTPVKLTGGVSSVEAAPGSASKITTRYFGNAVQHDFNGDGRQDVAFLLTQETGGTGVYYYVVAALNTINGYVGSDAVLLGDRIAPQTTEMGKGNIVIVNYADRKTGESFSVQPSVGKSIWLLLDIPTMKFGEVAQNFEGEADPSRMTLTMKPWTWISATYSDGKVLAPVKIDAFKLTFRTNNQFDMATDCNNGGGTYTVNGTNLTFSDIMSTQMFCQGSQESDFAKLLNQTKSFHFTSKGELIFDLKLDSGTVMFK